MGFLQICTGVVLLQMSKSAKDVPDAAIFKGDLDQVREIAEVEQPETEPKADAIRGTAAIIRRFSQSRARMEHEEAKRLREDRMADHLEPLRENEVVEWDGLRRRKTIIGDPNSPAPVRRMTIHPPLGMSHFPDASEDEREREGHGLFEALRNRTKSAMSNHPQHANTAPADSQSPMHPVALTDITIHPSKTDSPALPYGPGSFEEGQEHIYGLPPSLRQDRDHRGPSPRSKPLPNRPAGSPALRTPQEARRQFSFSNFLHRKSAATIDPDEPLPPSRAGLGSRASSGIYEEKRARKNATEEERLGLVKGDSHAALLDDQHAVSSPPERLGPPILAPIPSHTSSDASIDDKYLYQTPAYPSRRLTESPSDSDAEDWQMTNTSTELAAPLGSRTMAPMASPERQRPTSSRRRPSPPRMYQSALTVPSPQEQAKPPIDRKLISAAALTQDTADGTRGRTRETGGPAVATYSHSQTSSLNQSRPQIRGNGDPEEARGGTRSLVIGGPQGTVSPDETSGETEAQRRRYQEQSRREREERRQRLRSEDRRGSWKPGQ